MGLPALPSRAAYLTINNARRRNALSLAVLRSLRDQLHEYNRSAVDGRPLLLPPFKPSLLKELEAASLSGDTQNEYAWLLHSSKWQEERKGLPNVIVLRSEGPVFSSGHDLGELRSLPYEEVKETFALCAEVMTMIRHCPAPVVGVIQGLATAAGCQLALTTDIPVANASTKFQLPGALMGLPCTSPSTAVGRRLGPAFTYRMLALAEQIPAAQLPAGAVEVVESEEAMERRVSEIVERLTSKTAPQPQALGKWAYWTHMSFNGSDSGGDGYEDAVAWAGRAMALHARADDAREGMEAFFGKRPPTWKL